MFNLDEYVLHKLSGHIGKVVAYDHQIIDGAYQPTIRVRVIPSPKVNQPMFVEDLVPLWERVEQAIKWHI